VCQHAGMNQDVVQVQCPKCLQIGQSSNRRAARWDCPCGYSYYFRRCSACGVVSHVTSVQRRHEPWDCTWCKAANQGYTSRNDPATATLGDLAADMASHGLDFIRRQPEPVRDTQPVLIVTTNEVPGYRAEAPGRLLVADFTYVPLAGGGFAYVAFVIDAYAGTIRGWECSLSKTTAFIQRAIRQAAGQLGRLGHPITGHAVHHSDAGSQYTSLRFAETLMLAGSIGTVGDAYDNALAETTIGLYKSECARDGSPFRDGPLATPGQVEKITSAWVHWYNNDRLMHRTGLRPPAEADGDYWSRPGLATSGGARLDMGPSRAATPGPKGQAGKTRPGARPGYGRPPHVKPGSRGSQARPGGHTRNE
jgi:transposase InsO family protein